MKLVKLVKSTRPGKKYSAVFEEDGRRFQTHFGAAGMDDYTLTHDKEQRARYRARHAKDLKGDYTRAGYLSYYILWGASTSIRANYAAFKRRFNL
jgi:hypothetical protein